jgi:uncharacterized protein (DUF2062 family)
MLLGGVILGILPAILTYVVTLKMMILKKNRKSKRSLQEGAA